MTDKKRSAKRRKIDQSTDSDRYKGIREIERHLYRDVKRGCEEALAKRGLSRKSWYDKDTQCNDK